MNGLEQLAEKLAALGFESDTAIIDESENSRNEEREMCFHVLLGLGLL